MSNEWPAQSYRRRVREFRESDAGGSLFRRGRVRVPSVFFSPFTTSRTYFSDNTPETRADDRTTKQRLKTIFLRFTTRIIYSRRSDFVRLGGRFFKFTTARRPFPFSRRRHRRVIYRPHLVSFSRNAHLPPSRERGAAVPSAAGL